MSRKMFETGTARQILRELQAVRNLLERMFFRRSTTLTFVINERNFVNPINVKISDAPGVALLVEFDGKSGTGNEVPTIGPVTFESSNTSVVTVDSRTGQLAYISAGTASITGTDTGNGMSASANLTVFGSSAVAGSAVLEFVAPGPNPVPAVRPLQPVSHNPARTLLTSQALK